MPFVKELLSSFNKKLGINLKSIETLVLLVLFKISPCLKIEVFIKANSPGFKLRGT